MKKDFRKSIKEVLGFCNQNNMNWDLTRNFIHSITQNQKQVDYLELTISNYILAVRDGMPKYIVNSDDFIKYLADMTIPCSISKHLDEYIETLKYRPIGGRKSYKYKYAKIIATLMFLLSRNSMIFKGKEEFFCSQRFIASYVLEKTDGKYTESDVEMVRRMLSDIMKPLYTQDISPFELVSTGSIVNHKASYFRIRESWKVSKFNEELTDGYSFSIEEEEDWDD
jgi:hypothetical protein